MWQVLAFHEKKNHSLQFCMCYDKTTKPIKMYAIPYAVNNRCRWHNKCQLIEKCCKKKKVYKSSYDLEMDSMEIPQILLWI